MVIMGFLIFILGLAIGSFLNVLIHRLPKKESILGFSKCFSCRRSIAWNDNIPIVSFFLLRGRCRNCGSKISWQYLLVESLTGFLFLAAFLAYGDNPVFLIYVLFLVSLLIVIAVIDLKRFVILDSLILTGFLVSLFYFLIFTFYFPSDCSIVSCSFGSSLFGVLFFAGVFLSIFLASGGRWIGFGDVKLAALLGFVFGFSGSVSVFYLTFFIGFIIAIILLGLKKADLKSEIPLGSIMSAAAILFLLSGFNLLKSMNADLILRLWTPTP